jgi:hypothetical protein
MHGFKRAQPKIPGGGWFRAPIELLSPSSESENGVGDTSDSTSSSDDGLRLDHLILGLGIKIKKPFTYDGRANLDILGH